MGETSGTVHYSLGHQLGSTTRRFGTSKEVTTHYHTQPIEFARPENGTRKETIKCSQCGKDVVVEFRSPGAVTAERIKRAVITIVFAGVGFLAVWGSQRSGIGSAECIGWVLLAIFGFIVVTNAVEIFEREPGLAVHVKRNPVLDIISPYRFADFEKHTIIQSRK